ncbi:MAG: SDR family NAD(P)-dependent oxidoreductase [Hyphomicrobiales bacterium]|nr:SDR family NAD(P)-dependent oxidoreductase [Hyphomicrobiales bacterium]
MSHGPLHDQHALISGASRGIGAAIAKALAAEGAALSLIARHWKSPDAAADGALRLAADVTDEATLAGATAKAVATHGPVTILVNNAGAAETAPFSRTDSALVRRMLALNLESVFALTRLVLPGMIAAGGGRVINIASTAGLKGYPYVSAYVAAKHGVVGFTRALALEVAKSGVTVNAICPGYTDTDLVAASVAGIAAKTGRPLEDIRAGLAASNPQGRLISPHEVAAAVVYLAGAAAGGINGATLSLSGGETA